MDNLFVFIMLFEYFRVPSERVSRRLAFGSKAFCWVVAACTHQGPLLSCRFQQRVLSWGIFGAILMRGVMIVAGVAAVKKFRWTSLLFAGILFLSSIKLLMEGDEDEDIGDNLVMRLSRRLVGATSEYDGDKFFTDANSHDDADVATGRRTKRVATPLLLCLVCVELSDVVFAVDSIPAVLGISTDPFVVYSSNVFAIMGLRALYTLVARAVDQMVYLKHAVCCVLMFISLKMILEYFHYHLSTAFSLGVVVSLLSIGCIASSLSKKKKKKDDEGPSSSYDTGDFRASPLRQRGGAHAYSAEDDLSRVMV